MINTGMEFKSTQIFGFEAAISGMRHPLQSYHKSDTEIRPPHSFDNSVALFANEGISIADSCYPNVGFNMEDQILRYFIPEAPIIGENDLGLMRNLAKQNHLY